MRPAIVWPAAVVLLTLSVAGSVWLLLFGGLEVVQDFLVSLSIRVDRDNWWWLGAYAVVCLLSQLLIVPSGSLILIAAGFIFSPLLAAGIFSVAQIICSLPVYAIGKTISDKYPNRFQALNSRFRFSADWPVDWESIVRHEGFLATVVLRLTPVIPSAAACLLAAGLGIGWSRFLLATVAVCWVRPLFFASVGGSLQALTALRDGVSTVLPLLLLFAASVALLLAKLFLRVKRPIP